MEFSQRRARTHRGRKHLEAYRPRVDEGPRRVLLTQGTKTSQTCVDVLALLAKLVRSRATRLAKRYETRPMEDDQLVLRLCEKHQCPVFAFGCSSKKRPDRLILGRVHDFKMLDVVELRIACLEGGATALNHLLASQTPVFVALGDAFENDDSLRRVRNLFNDLFRGGAMESVNLRDNLGFAIVLAVTEDKRLCLRLFRAEKGQMTDLGLRLDFTVDRVALASNADFEAACRQPKAKKQAKNVEENAVGQKLGRVHVQQQDLRTLRLRKIRRLRVRGSANGTAVQAQPDD